MTDYYKRGNSKTEEADGGSSEEDNRHKLKISIDSQSYIQATEFDEKVRHCGMDCYEKTWDDPKFCKCFPYEMGIRILMIFLIMVFVTECIIFLTRFSCVSDSTKFDSDWQQIVFIVCQILYTLIGIAYVYYFARFFL